MALKKVMLTGFFMTISLISLFSTLSFTFLIFSSYAIVYGLDLSIVSVTKIDATSLSVNVSIHNPTQNRLSLHYIKIIMYVDGCQFEHFEAYNNNPKVLESFSNTTLLIHMHAIQGNVLPSNFTYWFATIYLLIYDVPLIDRAYFTSRAYGPYS